MCVCVRVTIPRWFNVLSRKLARMKSKDSNSFGNQVNWKN